MGLSALRSILIIWILNSNQEILEAISGMLYVIGEPIKLRNNLYYLLVIDIFVDKIIGLF